MTRPVPRLRRSDCHSPGIRRDRRGRGFSYRWPDGRRVTDPDVLARITALAIPPAWNDVWICPWPHGHIQAVGTDKAGRRQYRYHDAWRVLRDHQKFEQVVSFGRALPRLRDAVERDLAGTGVTESRVVAAATRLLDLGLFRIGGEQYAQEHETFGIATLQRRHVRLHQGEVIFDYPAKGSIERIVSISDPASLEVVRLLKAQRGRSADANLFAYKSGQRWVDMRSADVNTYIRQAAGGEYSAKDFRTWSATVLAAVHLAAGTGPAPLSVNRRRHVARQAVREVSEYLGNTPAVCRNSYIDPRVFDRFEGGETVASALGHLGAARDIARRDVRERIEAAVVELLEEEPADNRTAAEQVA
ncbi:MAG TPA: hypothetical protein VGL60_01905 [Acidimicrobiales bacterium]|jgi:DNA topoisomerase IB